MVRTRYGGSEALPRTPDQADPRAAVTVSKIDADPRLKTMWAGYAFARDFREDRGHAYMLEDQTFTKRQTVPQPGACLACHASVYTAYKKMGDGDIAKGFEKFGPMPYAEARQLVKMPVACIDCHDSQTMQLRITRPAFIEGIKVYKAAQGIADYDVNKMATRQEMRSFVCAQCHVEYYFKGAEKRLTFPWHNGVRAEQILAYYDQVEWKDWVHADTGALALKAQHPEFEVWSRGVHARAGVACADCHMPYLREGAMKISDHHVRSPLLNINNACQTCHRVGETEIKARAEAIQHNFVMLRNQALDAVVALIQDLKAAREAGRSDAELAVARDLQRRAQFLTDFVEAENSTGFHAPQETTRVLGVAINLARQGQIALRDPKYQPQLPPLPTEPPREEKKEL
jgi:nitrite reductase (cytochrome c-552)